MWLGESPQCKRAVLPSRTGGTGARLCRKNKREPAALYAPGVSRPRYRFCCQYIRHSAICQFTHTQKPGAVTAPGFCSCARDMPPAPPARARRGLSCAPPPRARRRAHRQQTHRAPGRTVCQLLRGRSGHLLLPFLRLAASMSRRPRPNPLTSRVRAPAL